MPDLPTGTVTFVFTDVEGSTSLWQDYPEAMPAVIVRHDAMLKALFAEHGGIVIRTVGDAVHAAFRIPSGALAAAVAAQRALSREPWGEGIALKVRMGIHSGAVDVQGGEYVGHTLNRVARIAAAGHGGQILLSAGTAELVRDALPAGTTLQDLGEHRLKDLLIPERIYSAVVADLPGEFRPLKTLDVRQTNLPARRSTLVGRQRELELARELLSRGEMSLLTLTGAGGTGKTSLALAIGHALLDRFRDGVWFVSLAPITDPALVPSGIISALGLREEGGLTGMQVLENHFASKQALLILDNFEQVTDAAPVVVHLLHAAPELTVLVTSRISLHLRQERELPVSPLSLPARQSPQERQDLSEYGAIQLFVARAQEVKPSFSITDDNAAAISEICSRLDGLPLAIELAAARIRVLPPQALLARLERRLPLLRGGSHDLPARQQTMESAIAWSYDLLTEEEQALYRRLSVFGRGFMLEQAEAICAPGEGAMELLEGITSLVDKSLIRPEDADGEPRFSMLQTIREYGLERLGECGELAEFQRRHAAYFVRLAETLERDSYVRGSSHLYGRAQAEWNNFRAALDWSLGESGDVELASRLIGALGWFWIFGEYASEGRARMEALLAHPDVPDSGEHWGSALASIAILHLQQGKHVDAIKHLAMSADLLRGSGNHLQIAKLTNWLAIPAINSGDAETAQHLFVESREHSRRAGLPWAETTATSYIAETLVIQGQLDEGRQLATEALEGFRDLHDAWGAGRMHVMLAAVAWLQGEYAVADTYCSDAVSLLRQVGEPYNASRAITLMGIILVEEAKYGDAERALTESLANWRTIGNRGGMILSLAGLAATAAGQGQLDRARTLYECLPTQHAENSLLLDPLMEVGFERFIRCIRERIGDNWSETIAPTTLEEIVNSVLEASPAIAFH